jgi:glycosyl transferase family 4
MMHSLLIVSYLFPPDSTVGAKRALRMATHLTDLGWKVEVLTAVASAYEHLDRTLLPERTPFSTFRSPTLDPKRWIKRLRASLPGNRGTVPAQAPSENDGLSISGRLLQRLSAAWDVLFSIPDVRAGWIPMALPAGLWKLRRPDLILATLPPFTNAVVACLLSMARGVPLILDYRDPWSALRQEAPGGIRLPLSRRRLDHAIEQRCLHRASLVVATTEGIRNELTDLGARRTVVVPNAFDAAAFAGAEPARYTRFTMAYAGTFYETRTVQPILQALCVLRDTGRLPPQGFALRVLGRSGPEVRALADRMGVSALVEIEGFLPHGEAIARMKGADVLLLVVGETHGRQIPAKLFEYIAAGRFILTLAPAGAEAGSVVRELQAGRVVDPCDVQGIVEILCERFQAGNSSAPPSSHSRRYEARVTMQELDRHLRDLLS